MRVLPLFLCMAAVAAAAPKRDTVPLIFISNGGQASGDVKFTARGLGLKASFSQQRTTYDTPGMRLFVDYVDATGPESLEGINGIDGKANFLRGARREWILGAPIYRGVIYRNLYPGIDLHFRGEGPSLKSEFIVAPGADAAAIGLRYSGAERVEVEEDGSLTMRAGRRVVREEAPDVYQFQNGERVRVPAEYVVADNTVHFRIGRYDHSLPLTIDPLIYAILIGGSGDDAAMSLAVDPMGATYIAGYTSSVDFPLSNPEQTTNAGGNEIFVAKFSATGNALVYCTYIGGRGDDRATGIAVDSTGAAYLTGTTTSTNFPLWRAIQNRHGGSKDAFALKLLPSGAALAYSTYLGGAGDDTAQGIALDTAGNAFITGDTSSTNFPISGAPTTNRGGTDAFVTAISADGTQLLYSRYIGGAAADHASAIAVDSSGAAFIAGSTYSPDFPVLSAYQATSGGGQDAFLLKLSPAVGSILFSTYLGGSGGYTTTPEQALAIAIDLQGNVYVAGETSSTNFPTRNPAQTKNAGWQDAFATKFTTSGALVYSTYIGGANLDTATAVVVDKNGNAYIGGRTNSLTLASLTGSTTTITGLFDGFVVKLTASGTAVIGISLIGSDGPDDVSALAIDAADALYAAGHTLSPTFPGANGSQLLNVSANGAFLVKIAFSAEPVAVTLTPPSPTLHASQAQQFGATVVNSTNPSVLWTLNPAVGSLSNTGLYLAPSTILQPQTVAITAASAADPTKTATATVTLLPSFSTNLALGAAASQSSLYDAATTAAKAIDGNTDGNYTHGSVTCTNSDAYAWWQLDLGASTMIDTIVIWNRTDGSMQRLSDYWIFLSDTPFAAWDTPYSLLTRAGTWSSRQTQYPNPSSGISVNTRARYVRIQLNGTNYLHMGEVQVYGSRTSVSVLPSSAVLAIPSQTKQFTATVLNSSNTAVTWSITPNVGSISATGLYTAPSSLSRAQTVTVTATLSTDVTKWASSTIVLTDSSRDIARLATASQSSMYDPATGAAKAIDGNTDGDYFHKSITCTGPDPFAWWQLDLGASTAIDSILIWNRTDGSMFRLSDYWVFVSDIPFAAWETPAALQSRSGVWSSRQAEYPNPFSLIPVNARGRYIRVQLNTATYLHMAEVQVFKAPDVGVELTPAISVLSSSQTRQFTASVQNSSNTGVVWSISPNIGGISSTGLYTAPPIISTAQTVTVTAMSVADPTRSSRATIMLAPALLNLAPGGTAAQSTQYDTPTAAAKAIDGNTDGNYFHWSVTCTNADPYAWWQVDLRSSAAIETITVWNRTDGSASRLSDYWIFVSDTPFGPADTPASLQGRSGTWSSHQTQFPNPNTTVTANTRGRYVRIQLNTANYLHIAEVQILGALIP